MDQFDIDSFDNGSNSYLVPPYLLHRSSGFIKEWEKLNLKNHFFILSSGTTSGDRINSYAISKERILINAKAVNQFLKILKTDKWLCSLPYFHIGGLSIYARCFLGGNNYDVYEGKWDASRFVEFLTVSKSQYTSLVPTQLYDIVAMDLRAPEFVKGVFVGGDHAPPQLLNAAINLGWKVIITYGMTETCSQVASDYYHPGHDGYMPVMNIHNVYSDNDNYKIESQSMFSKKIVFIDSAIEIIDSPEKLTLFDNHKLKQIDDVTWLKPLGRKDDYIKVSGRLINLLDVRNVLSEFLTLKEAYRGVKVSSLGDVRLGHKVLVEVLEKHQGLIEQLREILKKHTSLGEKHFVIRVSNSLETTALGKFKK